MTDGGIGGGRADARSARTRRVLVALATLSILAVIAYAGILASMSVYQNDLIFEPSASSGASVAAGVSAADADVITSDGERLRAWYRAADTDAPLVLYFHGNKGALIDYAARIEAYLDAGFGVLAIDYRGFGDSTGTPSLDGIIEDGRAALRFATRAGVPSERIVLHGFSLGGMVATALAAEADVGALVLEAPFDTLANSASERYWFLIPALVGPLIDGGIDPIEVIASVDEPLMVLHGTADAITPIEAGRAVHAAATHTAPFVAVEGGTHQSLFSDGAYETAIAFIRAATALPSD